MTTLNLTNTISRPPLRLAFLLIPLVLACFALSPQARAVCQEGCLTNFNTVLGDDALFSLTTGVDNTAIGFNALYSNTIGTSNTAVGSAALLNNTEGENNTAIGTAALYFNATGAQNTASGFAALFSNTTGSNNTATGLNALTSNTEGFRNTANGRSALKSNTTGGDNTASGDFALFSNVNGNFNTAVGSSALYNYTGGDNTATGYQALFSSTTGGSNVADGLRALYSNTIGTNNTASGNSALYFNTTGVNNTATGYIALFNNTTGSNNIALGNQAGQNLTTGSFNIDIGSTGVAGDARKIRIGVQGTQNGTFIAGISGATVPGGVGVIVGTNGKLGTVVSSARFKDAIKPMDKASEAILALKPVTFHYKKELDPDGIPQFGLVAEDVEKVNPDLVACDDQGKVYTVRYEAVNAMLLNEFLKAHRKMQEQETTILQLKSTIAQQQKGMEVFAATLKEQASQIQKVSAQLEVQKPAQQTVADSQ